MPSDSLAEQAYRQYLRSVEEAWANLDVEALDLTPATSPAPIVAMACLGTWGTIGTMFCAAARPTSAQLTMPAIPALACLGTYGSFLCYGCAA